MKKKLFLIFLFIIIMAASANAQTRRSFDQIFPSINSAVKEKAFSEEGNVAYSRNAAMYSLIGGSSSGIPASIANNILNKNPGYYIECVNVFRCDSSNITTLDIYNALSNIRGLKGILYNSYTRGAPTPLFEDATRIRSQSNTSAIPDPAPVRYLPLSKETIYLRLKDVNFGNTYYRGDVSAAGNGLSYSLTNFRAITYFLITVIKAESFTAQLYIEPIQEGILIYSIAGADISNFAASQIDVNSAVSKRLGVITEWAKNEIFKKAGF